MFINIILHMRRFQYKKNRKWIHNLNNTPKLDYKSISGRVRGSLSPEVRHSTWLLCRQQSCCSVWTLSWGTLSSGPLWGRLQSPPAPPPPDLSSTPGCWSAGRRARGVSHHHHHHHHHHRQRTGRGVKALSGRKASFQFQKVNLWKQNSYNWVIETLEVNLMLERSAVLRRSNVLAMCGLFTFD